MVYLFYHLCKLFISHTRTPNHCSEKSREGDKKKDAARKKKPKEQQPTALVLDNHSAINKAQNKILDLVADQVNIEKFSAVFASEYSFRAIKSLIHEFF